MSKKSLRLLLAIAALAVPAAPTLAEEVETDEAGRIVRSVDDDGVVTLYRYDEEGRLIDVQQADQVSAPTEPSPEPAPE